MTEDTRRALEIIKPMADELRIEVKAVGDMLLCNGQAIGISCNSTHATIMEFIGYVFATVYNRERIKIYHEEIPPKLRDRIKRYWYSDRELREYRAYLLKDAPAQEEA